MRLTATPPPQTEADMLRGQLARLQDEIKTLRCSMEQMNIDAVDDAAAIETMREYPGLSKGEGRLLAFLLARPGMLRSKNSIMTATYFDRAEDDNFPEPKIVDVFICKIRKKLREVPELAEMGIKIETVWGRGYRATRKAAE